MGISSTPGIRGPYHVDREDRIAMVQSARDGAWNAALEAAAKLCDETTTAAGAGYVLTEVAQRIRAMKR